MPREVMLVRAGPNEANGYGAGPVNLWPDNAWRRLIAAVADPTSVWAAVSRCPDCRRPLAGSDCEPDEALCWRRVGGACS